ncbi:MAG: GNAT family N-acyltransferase [Candidatus Cloacimonadaceae bacterium]|nr:GNAT family N-acyltransferase [Candidatus Cloacimonadaceae bacterium]
MLEKNKAGALKLMQLFIKKNRKKHFSAHIHIQIEKKNFIVRTADSTADLHACLKLRHDVFLEELLHKKKKSGMDVDRFDHRCDHLMIIDKRNDNLIGTYRLQSSLHTKKWYTATEFHMKQIKKLPGNKLELGRACVHQDYRNGITIALLWEGIHAYMLASQTKYMFGCSSIKTMDKEEIRSIYFYLKNSGYTSDDHKVRPKGKFTVPGLKRHVRKHGHTALGQDLSMYKDRIPSLLHSYLKVGAKVCGAPALDRSFKCIDFLTLLDVEDIAKSYTRKMNN